MANEISITARLDVENGNYKPGPLSFANVADDQAAQGAAGDVQEIGTTEETLVSTGLTNKGWLIMRNLDDTNYVEWGFSTGVYGGKLDPGGSGIALFKTGTGTTIYMKANTGACKVQFRWNEA